MIQETRKWWPARKAGIVILSFICPLAWMPAHALYPKAEQARQVKNAEPRSKVYQNAQSNLKSPSKYDGVDPRLVKAAQGMEGMFLGYMVSVMRNTVPDNEMSLENHATKIYRSLLDTKYVEKSIRAGGVGLADQIIDYYIPRRYNRNGKLAERSAHEAVRRQHYQGGQVENKSK